MVGECHTVEYSGDHTENKNLLGRRPELSKVPSWYAWSTNIALHNIIPTARASSLLIYAFPVRSTSLSPKPLQTKTAKCLEPWKEFDLLFNHYNWDGWLSIRDQLPTYLLGWWNGSMIQWYKFPLLLLSLCSIEWI